MIQYNTLNVKLFNSQLNKINFGTNNGTELCKFHQMLLVILMIKISFRISYY